MAFAASWGTLATSLSALGTAPEIRRLCGPLALLLACFLVGAGGAGTAVGPAAVISSTNYTNRVERARSRKHTPFHISPRLLAALCSVT
jgi:hypothetical protein